MQALGIQPLHPLQWPVQLVQETRCCQGCQGIIEDYSIVWYHFLNEALHIRLCCFLLGGALEWLGIDSQEPSELFDNGKGFIKKTRRGFNVVERLEQPLYQTKGLWKLLCKIVNVLSFWQRVLVLSQLSPEARAVQKQQEMTPSCRHRSFSLSLSIPSTYYDDVSTRSTRLY